MTEDRPLRIAIRKFGPFESAIRKQWEMFSASLNLGSVQLSPLIKNDFRSYQTG